MKKIFVLNLFSFLIVSGAFAQHDFRKNAPKPGPAPRIELGKAEQFTLKNGLKVIVVENHKLPKVSFQVFVDVPPFLEGEAVGYGEMAGLMLNKGTTKRTKSQIDESVDFIGASLTSSASGIEGACLKKHQDKLLDLLSDVLLNPTFPAEEFDKLKKQASSALAQAKDDPNEIAANVSSVLRNGPNHPYGEVQTEKTLEKISVDKCRAYYQQYFKPNISYLIVTGDIAAKDVKPLATKYFGDWAQGDVKKTTFAAPQKPAAAQLDFVDKTGAVQSVINVTYPIDLKPGSEDDLKAKVLNTLLGGYFSSRLNNNLREDKAYTYGARSVVESDPVVGYFNAYASVRNEVTDSAMTEFLMELDKLRNEDVGEAELTMVKNVMTGSFARSLEDPETVARFALNIARFGLPADYYATYLERLSKVTKEDIRAMAQKYLTPANAHLLVVGSKDEVAEKLVKFAPSKKINYFDVYGQPISEVGMSVPAGTTAQTVLNDYLNAVGGSKLAEIKTVVIEMGTVFQGVSMETVLEHMAPNKLAMTNSMMGNVIMESVFDGEKGRNVQMGQKTAMEGNDLADMKVDGRLFPERFYSDLGVKTELKGIEMVEGKKAYKLQIEYPSGTKKTHYFDVETSLKIREIEQKGENIVTNDISEYREVSGIKFPYVTNVTGLAPMAIKLETKAVTVNGEMDANIFKVD